MRFNFEGWGRTLIDKRTSYFNTIYKTDDELEDDPIADWLMSGRKNTYLKIMNDIEQTKEAAVKMNNHNIRKTNDPRMNNYNTGNIYAVINGKAYAPEMIRMIHIDQAVPGYEFTIEPNPRYAVENTMLSIKNVIFNPPATIVFWGDGSKTVVKCQEGDEYDPEKGLAMAFFKRMHGNKGRYCEEIKKWTKKFEEKYPTDNIYAVINGKAYIPETIETRTGSEGVTVEFHGNNWVDVLHKIVESCKDINKEN